MIDPSSSEEEGEDDTVVNLPSKGGRISSVPHKSVALAAGPSTSSTGGGAIPILTTAPNAHNGDSTGNHRPSTSVAGNGNGAIGSSKNDQPQSQFSTEGGNLEVPNNGIPRFAYINKLLQCPY